MFLSSLKNPEILKESLCNNLHEIQIQSCILDEMRFTSNIWNEVSINNSNANQTLFENLNIASSSFSRSNLFKSTFANCSLSNTTFSCNTFISSNWYNCNLSNISISQSTMQNIKIGKCVWKNSNLVDFEGINALIKNSFFINCRFEISSGMTVNGFSGGKIENSIFINCSFKGFPLRGVNTDSCIFINCQGEISDDISCYNTFGLGNYSGILKDTKLYNREKALKLIEELQ